LASGGATHKLKALLAGKPILQHVIDAVRASGLHFHVEDAGHPGMGDSIAAAVRATPDANGWLVLPGDLPLIQPSTLRLLADLLARHEVVAPVFNGQRGHPVGFSKECREQLMNLQGEQGASRLVRSHIVKEVQVEDIGTVTDVDTVEALRHAQALLDARG
jgi:molybdenum cofactor cytidylyltransferase